MQHRSLSSLLVIVLVGCGGGTGTGNGDDAGDKRDAVNVNPQIDASTSLGSTFRFGIVGDTRPANEDDTPHYPTAVITKIWSDIQSSTPHPDFAVSTGDYQFSNPNNDQAAAQLALYLGARAQFTNAVYAAMGNHECTGATASNCGTGNTDGITKNYTAYMTDMLGPGGFTKPYFMVPLTASDNSWTAKLVFIAANAWDSTQSAWLSAALAQPTTYTFVIRHEDRYANTAPGVTPSETIINAHPYTLKIVGHTHTYAHYASEHEVICGNGGAPLTSGTNYGYGIVERLADGKIQFTEYDYQTNASTDQFRVNADGSLAP